MFADRQLFRLSQKFVAANTVKGQSILFHSGYRYYVMIKLGKQPSVAF